MRKILNIISRCFGLLILCSICIKPVASGVNDIQLGKEILVTHRTSNKNISEKILKKEELSISNYKYPGGLDKCGYKYLKARRDITYLNKIPEKTLALASIESNFRYNPSTLQAECLSVSREVINNESGYTLSLFCRSANKTTEVGACVSDIKFRHLGSLVDRDDCEIECDYMSNLEVRDLSK